MVVCVAFKEKAINVSSCQKWRLVVSISKEAFIPIEDNIMKMTYYFIDKLRDFMSVSLIKNRIHSKGIPNDAQNYRDHICIERTSYVGCQNMDVKLVTFWNLKKIANTIRIHFCQKKSTILYNTPKSKLVSKNNHRGEYVCLSV